jgi:hypothetical protein
MRKIGASLLFQSEVGIAETLGSGSVEFFTDRRMGNIDKGTRSFR